MNCSESICRWQQWFDGNIFHDLWSCDFTRGIIVGIGGYLVVLFIVHFLFFIFRRRKKCTLLAIPGDNGTVRISLRAITGVLRQELAGFTQLTIDKILIFNTKHGYIIELRGQFNPGKSGTPDLFTGLSEAVRIKMNTIFGIDNIYKVDLHIAQCAEPEDTSDPEFTVVR